jgi:hypothetical protein
MAGFARGGVARARGRAAATGRAGVGRQKSPPGNVRPTGARDGSAGGSAARARLSMCPLRGGPAGGAGRAAHWHALRRPTNSPTRRPPPPPPPPPVYRRATLLIPPAMADSSTIAVTSVGILFGAAGVLAVFLQALRVC